MHFETQLVAWAFGLLTVFIVAVFGLLKWFFSRYISGVDAQIAALENRLSAASKESKEAIEKEANQRRELEREFRGFLALLPQQYVAREDWILMASKFDSKMDGLANMLTNAVKELLIRGPK